MSALPPVCYDEWCWMFSIFVVLIAFFLALLEIEVEGCRGWAEDIPTPKLIDTKRSLTLYHVYLFCFVLIIMCAVFFIRSYDFTFFDFLYILALTIMVMFLEDIYWFMLNPCYGFKKLGQSWWHAKLGPIPIVYVVLPVIATLLAWGSGYIETFGRSLVTLLIGTAIIFFLSFLYHPFYKWTHKNINIPLTDEQTEQLELEATELKFSQEGSSQEGSSQEGSSQEGSSQKGLSKKGSSKKGSSQKGLSKKGSSQKGLSQKG